jgi:hypothetical protein
MKRFNMFAMGNLLKAIEYCEPVLGAGEHTMNSYVYSLAELWLVVPLSLAQKPQMVFGYGLYLNYKFSREVNRYLTGVLDEAFPDKSIPSWSPLARQQLQYS